MKIHIPNADPGPPPAGKIYNPNPPTRADPRRSSAAGRENLQSKSARAGIAGFRHTGKPALPAMSPAEQCEISRKERDVGRFASAGEARVVPPAHRAAVWAAEPGGRVPLVSDSAVRDNATDVGDVPTAREAKERTNSGAVGQKGPEAQEALLGGHCRGWGRSRNAPQKRTDSF